VSDLAPHTSVLLAEVVELLEPKPGKLFLDGTAGAGGHAFAFAEAGAQVIALDQDPAAQALATARLAPFGDRCRVVLANFGDARSALDQLGVPGVDGALLDLGVSSMQLDTPERGFSFRTDAPLDMRMGQGQDGRPSAREKIAAADDVEIANVLRDLGEERFAKQISRSIKRAARMETTFDLVRAVEQAVPRGKWPKGIHVATRTFQALRLWVNEELGALDRFLTDLPGILASGARAAIISFHSLEDRAVKQRFIELSGRCSCPPKLPICVCGAGGGYRVLTKRPIVASEAEVARNPRARSAKLRGLEKVKAAA
jgi:16S rRNA (cytosine1402-N4)-methyltransferase